MIPAFSNEQGDGDICRSHTDHISQEYGKVRSNNGASHTETNITGSINQLCQAGKFFIRICKLIDSLC